MIKIENINKYFNRFKKNQIHVINNTSLELGNVGLVALLGPSGSGKTTLLNVIGGLDKVTTGKIFVDGVRITKRLQGKVDKIRNLNIGYIFQDYKLVDDLSVYDNVALVLKINGIKDKKEIDKRVCYVLDKVGILRYKKRPASMLSGGERQRVGIARALVKNPNIIIADEPTGNLDSRNSVEIMNIIKAISKDKLVILVTHEANLAKFYATRIIELEDGKIVKDYQNENDKDLDYQIDNTLYLKDYKYNHEYDGINLYTDLDNVPKIDIVVSKNNIYIRSLDNKKIEVVDNSSAIEMKNEHYKNISKENIDKYQFDYQNIISDQKMKYSSIFNPWTFVLNGFNKVLNYSLLKKILLGGFFLSGIFIMYSASSVFSSLTIKDSNFVNINKNYAVIEAKKIKVEDYDNYQNNLGAKYILPGDSLISVNLKYPMYYQTSNLSVEVEASLTSIQAITEDQLIMGRMPENENEVVLDEMAVKKSLKLNAQNKMMGITKVSDYLDKELYIQMMPNLKIVGIVSNNSPSIYMADSKFINTLYYTNDKEVFDLNSEAYHDYALFMDKINLKEGRWPTNDYEVIVNYARKEEYKLNKEINKSINNRKLVVVGYYTSKDRIDSYFVNNNMIKIKVIENSSNIVLYSDNVLEFVDDVRSKNKINIKDSYTSSREKYLEENKRAITSALTGSIIILLISLIEVFLMIRSSFLSRIKEVGIYRAIGVKKFDIYVMFSGEIIAITTMASLPGILLCAYIIKLLLKVSYLQDSFVLNGALIFGCVVLAYLFNLVIGLIPVFNTIRKRPAEILARTDI